ncbi:hypothetical protein [Micromonospora tarensis]|uniref:Uncharacterized protein n=1 Tax=Micromonospora tarensis TaxID=2806100 RepID=A0ABS1YPA8_9ACTN|nr:hypothetical protein [Micromonospora tarensis]MBM0279250.1 hypothetical protein [Micromonospora tarensis]
MPARRNPKKSRTPKVTPLGTTPAAGHGPLSAPPTQPVDSVPPVEPLAAPAPDELVVVDVRAVVQSPPARVNPQQAAPKAGPPQAGAARSAGGKSQRTGQPRRYAFRRS